MASPETVKKEYQRRLSDRANHDEQWQSIANYFIPEWSNITSKRAIGEKLTTKLYDATGIDAAEKLIAALAGTLTNQAFRWFSLRMRQDSLNFIPEVREWLETTSDILFQSIAQSNFRTVSTEVYQSIVNFGTGFMFQQEKDPLSRAFSGYRFEAQPIGTYVFAENGQGIANQFTRSMKMELQTIVNKWGEDSLHPERREQLRKSPMERIEVLHDVRPVDPQESRWESMYLDFEKAHPLSEGFFKRFPAMIPRWSRVAGETFGRGRGHIALPEVRTLNRARQLKLRLWASTVSPPLQTLDDGVIGTPRLLPGAQNIVTTLDAIKPIDLGARFDHTAIPENESKLQIRQIFFTEQLLQFAAAAKTPPTATEVLQRMEFLHQLLGPAVGRLQDEFLSPLISLSFDLALDGRAIPEPPLVLLGSDGQIDIEYEGPLARAQRSDELRSLSDLMTLVGGIAQYDQEVLDIYDLDMVAKDLPRITGSRQRYLRSDREVERRRRIRAEALAQQQQAELVGQGAAAARDVGQASQSFAQAGTAA